MTITKRENVKRDQIKINSASLSQTGFLFLLTLIWTKDIILQFVRALLLRIPFVNMLADEIIIFMFAVSIVLALFYMIKHVRLSDLFFYIGVLLIYLLNIILFTKNEPTLYQYFLVFLFNSLPLYFVGISVDVNSSIDWLYKLSLLTIVLQVIYSLTIGTPMDAITSLYEGDMDLAYHIVPHVCIVLWRMFEKINVYNVLIGLIGLIYLFTLGTRGAVVCCLVFIALYLIFFRQYKKPVFAYSVIILGAGGIIVFLKDIMAFLNTMAIRFGLSIRIFEKFNSGDLLNTSGRDVIQTSLMEAIRNNPMWGYGIGSDRAIAGNYAHNLAIELWVSFGVILGTLVLLTIVFILLKGFKSSSSPNAKIFILVLFCCSFIKLFLSGSFLSEGYLFLLLGICVGQIRTLKRHLKKKELIHEANVN